MTFAGLLFFIVLIFVRPQDFFPLVRGLPLVNITMIIVSFVWILERIGERGKTKLKIPQNLFMVLLWAVIVISTLSVHWIAFTFNTLIDWGKIVLIYFVIADTINSRKRLVSFLWIIVLCLSFTAVAGILQFYGHDITGVGATMENGLTRIRGVGIFDVNQLAYTLAFSFPLLIGLFLISRSFSRIILFSIAPLYVYCIYLTQSRGGLLCLVFVLAFSLFVFSRNKSVKIIAVILGIVFYMGANIISSRMAETKDYKEDKSVMGRVEMWGQALASVKYHPFFGLGKDQFTESFERAAHNSYIQTISEIGILGLYCWIGLFYLTIVSLLKISKLKVLNALDKQENILAKTFLISMMAYLFSSLFSSSAYYITLFLLFALAVALSHVAGKKRPLPRFGVITIRDFFAIAIIEIGTIASLHIFTKISFS